MTNAFHSSFMRRTGTVHHCTLSDFVSRVAQVRSLHMLLGCFRARAEAMALLLPWPRPPCCMCGLLSPAATLGMRAESV